MYCFEDSLYNLEDYRSRLYENDNAILNEDYGEIHRGVTARVVRDSAGDNDDCFNENRQCTIMLNINSFNKIDVPRYILRRF